jgi:hypothetical protein
MFLAPLNIPGVVESASDSLPDLIHILLADSINI